MTEDRWEIAWSHQVEGRVGAISCLGEDSLIAFTIINLFKMPLMFLKFFLIILLPLRLLIYLFLQKEPALLSQPF